MDVLHSSRKGWHDKNQNVLQLSILHNKTIKFKDYKIYRRIIHKKLHTITNSSYERCYDLTTMSYFIL